MDDQRLRQHHHLGHRRERPAHVVGHGLAHHVHRRGGARRHVERIAVGRRVDDRVHPDQGSAPGAVVDDELLAEDVGQMLADQACERVGAAARRRGDDDPHRPVGVVGLCRGGAGAGEEAKAD